MARQLKETANAASTAVAMPEGTARTVPADSFDGRPSYMKREWKAYTTNQELPPAKYKTFNRERKLQDGTVQLVPETKCTDIGEARYKVVGFELIKIYKKHGGTGTKMIYRFKQYGPNVPDFAAKNKFMREFRRHLHACGIPGA